MDGKMALTLPEVLKCEDVERSISSFPRLSAVNQAREGAEKWPTSFVFLELCNKLFQNIVLCVTGYI